MLIMSMGAMPSPEELCTERWGWDTGPTDDISAPGSLLVEQPCMASEQSSRGLEAGGGSLPTEFSFCFCSSGHSRRCDHHWISCPWSHLECHLGLWSCLFLNPFGTWKSSSLTQLPEHAYWAATVILRSPVICHPCVGQNPEPSSLFLQVTWSYYWWWYFVAEPQWI